MFGLTRSFDRGVPSCLRWGARRNPAWAAGISLEPLAMGSDPSQRPRWTASADDLHPVAVEQLPAIEGDWGVHRGSLPKT